MRYITLFIILVVLFVSCKKWVDPKAQDDSRLTSLYCNVPDAVNYNWAFPGTPDSTTCFYPTQVFGASYVFMDSVYYSDNFTLLFVKASTFHVYPINKTKLAIVGFCGPNDSLKLTADRFFRATLDTMAVDGQFFCRQLDTISGLISRSQEDSIALKVNFTVISDTGINYHRGTARRQ